MLRMASILKATEGDNNSIVNIGKLSVAESHRGSCSEEEMNEFLERYYNSDAIKEELNDINNIYYIINYNDKPVGFSKIILNAKHPNTKGWRIYIRTNATAMRVLFLSLITILITYEMSFSQKELERELRKMTIQDKSAENSYIDSLFHLTATKNDEIITDKVDKVYDRYELLLVTKNYEKVVQVYDSG